MFGSDLPRQCVEVSERVSAEEQLHLQVPNLDHSSSALESPLRSHSVSA